jgi:hypothetical protein
MLPPPVRGVPEEKVEGGGASLLAGASPLTPLGLQPLPSLPRPRQDRHIDVITTTAEIVAVASNNGQHTRSRRIAEAAEGVVVAVV